MILIARSGLRGMTTIPIFGITELGLWTASAFILQKFILEGQNGRP
jgi:hypothetical protein